MPNGPRAIQILPSILAAPIGWLEQGCRRAIDSGADGLHVDIMDAHFVPNLSLGPPVVKMARDALDPYINTHLMMTNPEKYAKDYAEAGTDRLLIHVEISADVEQALRDIRALGVSPGLTLNPDTMPESVFDAVDAGLADEVLCMSVYPGFGGQSFIPKVLDKIRLLRERYPELDINVDGGIDDAWGPRAAEAGANVFVAGTYLFGAEDMAGAIASMREAVTEAAARGWGYASA
jgi:ribulose-phosphate 3-epimerase